MGIIVESLVILFGTRNQRWMSIIFFFYSKPIDLERPKTSITTIPHFSWWMMSEVSFTFPDEWWVAFPFINILDDHYVQWEWNYKHFIHVLWREIRITSMGIIPTYSEWQIVLPHSFFYNQCEITDTWISLPRLLLINWGIPKVPKKIENTQEKYYFPQNQKKKNIENQLLQN